MGRLYVQPVIRKLIILHRIALNTSKVCDVRLGGEKRELVLGLRDQPRS